MGESESALFVGEGSLLTQAALHWLEAGHRVVGVVARDGGIAAFAKARGIPLIAPGDDDAIVRLSETSPFGVLLSVANLAMMSPRVVRLVTKWAINFHDAPLPRYAGLNATTWAIAAGETTHGVTWHEMTATPDTGRILVQRVFDVAADETAFSLNAKCYAAGIESFAELAARISDGTLAPTEQDGSARTYFGLRDRPGLACCIESGVSAVEIERLVRALDYGSYPNPVGRARVVLDGSLVLAAHAEVVDGAGAPGEVIASDDESMTVATPAGAARLSGLTRLDGEAVRAPRIGERLSTWSADERDRLLELSRASAGDERFFLARLEQLSLPTLAFVSAGTRQGVRDAQSVDVPIPPSLSRQGSDGVVAATLAFLARLSSARTFDVAFSEPRIDALVGAHGALFARAVPLRVRLSPVEGLSSARAAIDAELAALRRRSTWAKDLLVRQPSLRTLPRRGDDVAWTVAVGIADQDSPEPGVVTADLAIDVAPDGTRTRWSVRGTNDDWNVLLRCGRQFALFVERIAHQADTPLDTISLLSDEETRALEHAALMTARPIPATTVHAQIEARVATHPDAVALRFRDERLTYRELDERANHVAHALRARGVGADSLVGVYLDRSPEMVIACLAIWKAGGAYVPLDPSYPRERIAFMIEDAKLAAILTRSALVPALSMSGAQALAIDTAELAGVSSMAPASDTRPEHLAYVIFTSGSTGRPKGVMVEHRNVVNFFIGMDERLGSDDAPGVWLAVTSLSFDISVLELFWTLARGFTVVLYREPSRTLKDVEEAPRPIAMSLFYFASNEAEQVNDRYRLLLDGARFADDNGFVAVWTPERHFHAFGGLFPNPSVTSAAIATITKRVGLRAGSCVSPLHSPIRVAEEWSVVDNLSGGRVGISFASGWQPNDFVIRPEGFADRKQRMFRDIETVRRLWRGESIALPDAAGREVPVSIYPRPVQAELPVWVTAAGNPETFEEAGRIGASVLTHLLGQTFAEVKEKVAIYREARAAAGHAGRGTVSIMLHTFVGEDAATVKETVRAPMKGYLKSAVGLIKEAAWSFPTFKQGTTLADGSFGMDHLSAADMDALLDHAFERYYATSGLFGDVAGALEIVDRVRACDVDEIACLIDFGLSSELVMQHLPMLATVRRAVDTSDTHHPEADADLPIGALMARHGATHLQCTPSMAMMLARDDAARASMKGLRAMLVGGEALSPALASDLRALVPGQLFNMYGPTETTVWSTAWEVPMSPSAVSIGSPLANTDVIVLDGGLQPAVPGAIGELAIGGLGVTRGYLDRPDLTAERFVPHAWRTGARMYRTGDLVRHRADGTLEFHGRVDQQVKIRGFRIELGEIEARLAAHAGVREAVVVAREEREGDARLVAFLIADRAGEVAAAELQAHVRGTLPDFMVPSDFVWVPRWPLTPNGKIDRKALVVAERPQPSAPREVRAPSGELEQMIATLWGEVLGVSTVGVDDNFFDLGGHSLLTVQLLAKLKARVSAPLTLVDLFRFSTVRQQARFLGSAPSDQPVTADLAARTEARIEGSQRRAALAQRRRG